MTRTPARLVPLVLAGSVMWSGCTNQQSVEQSVATKSASPTVVRAVPVSTETVTRTSTQPATVRAFFTAELRSKVDGYLRAVKADIGDAVRAGQVLAVVDVPEMVKRRAVLEARIERRLSNERQAEAGVQLAAANVKSAGAMLERARSEAGRAEASLAAAVAEFARTEDLVERRSLERRMLDEVRKKRDADRAAVESVRAAIVAAGADVAVARAKAAAAEADLDAAKAETLIARRELEELDVLIDYAEIKAPFDAVVTERMAEPGNLVLGTADAGRGEPLFVVSRVDRVRIHVPVPEADAAFVDRGDMLALRLPSFEGEREIETTVTRVGGALDPNTRTMLVEAELENADGKYLPGMFGEATITLGERPAVAVLPARAVRFGESGDAYVYALGADDVVRVVGVTTGVDEGARIEIVAGVVPGDRVVDAHLERLTDGEAVTVLAD